MGLGILHGGADGGDGGLAGTVVRVDRALDALAGLPYADLPLAEQAEAVTALVRLRSRLEAVEAVVLSAFDAGGEWALDGHRSAGAALAHRCQLSRAEARRRLRLARRLRHTPVVAAALTAGEITGEQASLILAARRPEVAAEFERDEGVLVDQARTLSFADLRVVVRYWSDRVDPQDAEDRAVQVDQQAQAHVSRTLDGLVRVDAWLEPIGGTTFLTAVERIEDELFRADWQEASAVHGDATTIEHLARTASQRRAAALVELAVRASAAPPDAKRPVPLVNVVMDAATFEAALRRRVGLPTTPPPLGTAGSQCEVSDGTVITPAQAIDLALAGHVRRVVYETPNKISHISPRRRLYTGTAREVLDLRDRTCTHPGCHQPAWRCEADHIEPWNGSNTTSGNGRLLCRYHHRLRHRLRHPPIALRRADGTLAHHRADGTPITGPPPRRAVPPW